MLDILLWLALEEPVLRNALLQHAVCAIIGAVSCFEQLEKLSYNKPFAFDEGILQTTVLVLSVVVNQFCVVQNELIDKYRR